METEELHSLRAAWHQVRSIEHDLGELQRSAYATGMNADELTSVRLELLNFEKKLSAEIKALEAQQETEQQA